MYNKPANWNFIVFIHYILFLNAWTLSELIFNYLNKTNMALFNS